jgi:hypothetical protein
MKTSTLPVLSFLAALAALVLLPVSLPAAAVAVTVTGITTILAADYGKTLEPLRAQAPVVPFSLSRAALDACRTAA